MVKGSLDLLPKRFTATRHQGKAPSVAFTASLCHVYEHVTVGVEDNQDGGAFQKFLHYLSCVAAKFDRKREHADDSTDKDARKLGKELLSGVRTK